MNYTEDDVELKFQKTALIVKKTVEYVSLQTTMDKVKRTLDACNKSKNTKWQWK